MNELLFKYNQLDDSSKLAALNFIDFLFEQKVKTSDDLSEYKKRILKVSTWSDSDLAEFELSRKILNNWTISEW
ncbi:MAG: hypothetical protein V1779_13770 [bacterium]